MINLVKSILKSFIVKSGFVDSNRASYVPFKLATEIITPADTTGAYQYYDYQGTRRNGGFVVSAAWADGKVVPVTLAANEGYVKPISAAGDVIIGYTNGDPELVLTEATPVRYSNIRINGHVMTGKPTGAAIAYGAQVSYNTAAPSADGIPGIQNGTAGVTEGSKMIALQAASSADIAAGKHIDFLVLL
jgi:hypothetical protein